MITIGSWRCTYPCIVFSSQDHGRLPDEHTSKITVGCPRGAHIQAFSEKLALSLKSTVGCPRGAQIQAFTFLLVKITFKITVVRRNHREWTPFEAIGLPISPENARPRKCPKNTLFSTKAGKPGQDASGMGASSAPSSSVSAAIAHIGAPSSAGTGAMCLAKSSPSAWSSLASATAASNSSLLSARSWRHPVLQTSSSAKMSFTVRAAHSAEDWRRHALFLAKPSKEPSRTERARRRLSCQRADGHFLKVKKAEKKKHHFF